MEQTKSMKKGFTLIELLVVIAIIAILAAILFPVFAKVREKARQISCLSNEKQTGTGLMMYVQDNEETFPLSQRRSDAGDKATFQANNPGSVPIAGVNVGNDGTDYGIVPWQYVVNPYIKNGSNSTVSNAVIAGSNFALQGGIFSCPSFPVIEPNNYGLNYMLAGDQTGWAEFGQTCNSANLSQVVSPGNKMLMVEKGKTLTAETPEWKTLGSAGIAPLTTTEIAKFARADNDTDDAAFPAFYPWSNWVPRFRHNGQTNVLFADGHAKSMNMGSFVGPTNWCHYEYSTGGFTQSTPVQSWGNPWNDGGVGGGNSTCASFGPQ